MSFQMLSAPVFFMFPMGVLMQMLNCDSTLKVLFVVWGVNKQDNGNGSEDQRCKLV